MKILSPDILHKSEIGGVVLNVADAAGASEAFDTIMARAKKAVPDAKIEGVLIAPMIRDGVETIMGVSRDPVFGPVVMFGLGGIRSEEHTSELQSLLRTSYAVFCLQKQNIE